MYDNTQQKYGDQRFRIPLIALVLSMGWGITVIAFLWWEVQDQKKLIYELSAIEAQTSFNKHLLYRRWSASHGGTYVPITVKTPPNPFLSHINERDITTPSGQALTLVNPAYMSRQVYELSKKQDGTMVHITSLKPIRKENQPDDWEIKALKAFEKGADEIQSIEFIDQIEYLRLMRPLATEKGCLKCHVDQGYKVGEILGGISVAIALKPYKLISHKNIKRSATQHFFILFTGLIGLGLASFLLFKKDLDRLATLKALKESEERLSHILTGSPVPTFVIDNNHVSMHWNTALEKMSGISSSQVIGTKNQWMAFYSTVRPVMADLIVDNVPEKEIAQHYRGKYKKSKNIENAYEAEDFFPNMGKNGRWLFFTATPLLNSLGETIGAVETLQNITARKKAEEALKKSEGKYRLIADNVTDVIWTADMDLKFTYISPSVRQLREYTPDEASKIPFEKTFTSLSYQKAMKSFTVEMELEGKPGVRPDRSVVLELDTIRKDGCVIPVEVKVSFLRDDTGSPAGLVGITRDISDRKQAEKALLESEAKFRTIFENKGTATVVYTKDSIIKECNAMFEELTGYSKFEILDKMEWSDFVVNEDLERMKKYHTRRQTNGERPPSQYECGIIHRKGMIRTVIININLVGDDRIVSLTDISANKRAEEKQKKLQEQLIQSQKMEVMGTLAGGIAHDFNNILSPILGYTEILLDELGSSDEQTKEHLEQIYTSTLRAKELVMQILTFSRRETTALKPVRIQPIVKEAVKLMRAAIPSNIEVLTRIDSECRPVFADATQIHQMVMNLMTNAYHAVGEEEGILKVALDEIRITEAKSTDGDLGQGYYLRLKVSDTGVGMSPELAKKVFDPFFTTKNKGKGTGMGLAVVHGIITNMGGAIRVKSVPGKGSEFRVYLPLDLSVMDKGTGVVPRDSLIRGKGQILLVDDEEAILGMQALALEKIGYTVKARISSIEALEAFKAAPLKFDLVITDLSMPKMKGDRLAQELRSIRPEIPIILCTGFSEQLTPETAKEMGIEDKKYDGARWLEKENDTIGAKISRWIEDNFDNLFATSNHPHFGCRRSLSHLRTSDLRLE